MFHWLRDHRRVEVQKRPFPPEWEGCIYLNNGVVVILPFFSLLG